MGNSGLDQVTTHSYQRLKSLPLTNVHVLNHCSTNKIIAFINHYSSETSQGDKIPTSLVPLVRNTSQGSLFSLLLDISNWLINHSRSGKWILNIFSCAFGPSIGFLWRSIYLDLPLISWLCYLFSFFLSFFFLSCMSCLSILEINSLLVVLFANIFPFWVLSFCFAYGFLCCAKAFKFN